MDSTLFEDLNRYCWQQNGSSDLSSQACNTDGQIYTLTVLNGNEPTWLPQNDQNITQRKINETQEGTPATALDFDSLLNTFPGYVKTEYNYDDSGFSTDNKDDMILSTNGTSQSQQQNQHQTQQTTQTLPSIQQTISVTNTVNMNNNINAAFHNNNNNDWQMADHNITVDNGNVCRQIFIKYFLEYYIYFVCLYLL